MKKRIELIEGIQKLRRNTKMVPDKMYVMSSESAAKNIYFYKKADILFAHRQIKRHLGGVMDIVDYMFSPYGFVLCVKTRREGEILEYCMNKSELSNTIQKAIENKDISLILSEYIRYTISSIASYTNNQNGRVGSVVRENFGRYVLETLEAGKELMKLMKKGEVKLCGQRKRFRPKLGLWDKKKELIDGGAIFLTTKRMEGVDCQGGRRSLVIEVSEFFDHVLRKIIKNTLFHHCNPKTKNTNSNSS